MTELREITYEDIINHKKITPTQLINDLNKLKALCVDENKNSFCGNKTLYHFQLENLLNVRRPHKLLLREVYEDPIEKEKLMKEVEKRNRTGTLPIKIFECFRINRGSVVFFKPCTAKFLYKYFNATSVLDPCAGWGGRMLGAWALDINYTGFDTNTDLKPAYDDMMTLLTPKQQMRWESSLTADFSTIDYDFVLTSPPYINLEIYNNMTPFKNNRQFYIEFLIPLIDKCRLHIKPGGKVAFNISPRMYEDLILCGYEECDVEFDLVQQGKGAKKGDKIYIW
jgi:hypothetical protein